MSESFISLSKPAAFTAEEIDVRWNDEIDQHIAWLGPDIRVHLTTAAAQAFAAGLATSLDAQRLGGAVTR